ncbi:MAG: calcium-binding protein [Geminicoccaceae bacterium]
MAVKFGNDLDNIINGTATADSLFGKGGDDSLFGGGGNDRLNGGNGADLLVGGAGTNTADYASDPDGIYVNLAGLYAIDGWGYQDELIQILNINGSTFDDEIITGGRNNVIWANQGDDSVDAGNGADTVFGGLGNDDIDAGAGADSVSGGEDDDNIVGRAGSDSIDGDAGDDYLNGGEGGDRLRGDSGFDIIVAAEGNDTIWGDGESDDIYAGSGNDKVWGGDDDDYIIGDDGNDSLYGGDEEDDIDAGGGNDLVDGGEDADNIWAGEGNDVIYGAEDDDSIEGEEGRDILLGEEDDDWLDGGDGDDFLLGDGQGLPLGSDVFSYGTGLFWDTYRPGDEGNDWQADFNDFLFDPEFPIDSYFSGVNLGIDFIADYQDGIDKISLFGFQEIFYLLDIGFDTDDPIGHPGIGPNGVLDNQDLFVDVEFVTYNGVTLASTIIDISGLIGAAVGLAGQLADWTGDEDFIDFAQFLENNFDQDVSTQQLIVWGAAGGTLDYSDFTGFADFSIFNP